MEDHQMNGYTEEMRNGQDPAPARKKRPGRVIGIIAVVLVSLLLAAGAGYSVKVLVDTAGGIIAGIGERRSAKAPEGESVPAPASQETVPGTQEASRINTTPVLQQTETKSGAVVLTDVSEIVKETLPSVVSINCTVVTTGRFGRYESASAGSGIIIGDNGTELWIVTNNHVIDGAAEMKVAFVDGSEAVLYLKGASPANDVAVLGVRLSDLGQDTVSAIRVIAMGDSDTLKLGQGVIAIGNALGWGQSVTTGVVSALDRTISLKTGPAWSTCCRPALRLTPATPAARF